MASLAIANNPDIRFLGRLLGDVIRAYGGEELFKRIEYIRATSVDRHRGVAGADAIDPGLDRLTLDETLDFVRGFMLFSMLANLAEDRQGVAAEQDADVAARARAAEGARHRARRSDGAARSCADRPGADRAPDRSAPQVDDRPQEPHRRADVAQGSRGSRRPRTATGSRRRSCARSRCSGRRACCAARSSASPTKSRPRSPICATCSCRCCPRSMRAGIARWATRAPSFLRAGSVDRRRPRRQSVRHRRIDAARARRGRPRRCSVIISTSVHALGAELSISTEHVERRCAACSNARRGEPRHRAAAARTSPIAARSRASMRGFRRRTRS